ncbi:MULTISPECIES: hypothetical protein [unclassified Nocardia]|uniref:hypothetical protein n=1 Tax=unclassified Nocardia TaxID=2637762 RepID=UPI001CE41D6A|nr:MULTISPECIES: hypothetical protein [unclassified Nocardia]
MLILLGGLFAVVARHGSRGATGSVTVAPTPSLIAPTTGFGPPQLDMLGRRVDVPNNTVGQPLPQYPSLQRTPAAPDWLTGAPHGVRDPGGWQRVFGASVPFSTSDGPARVEDGLVVGYAHTPQGAALAAAQIYYRSVAHPSDRALYDRQMVLTESQKAEIDRDGSHLPQLWPEAVTRYLVASDAFRIPSYSTDFAVVELATPANIVGARTWRVIRLAVTWVDSDWRLTVPAAGSVAQTLTSLEGWTPW